MTATLSSKLPGDQNAPETNTVRSRPTALLASKKSPSGLAARAGLSGESGPRRKLRHDLRCGLGPSHLNPNRLDIRSGGNRVPTTCFNRTPYTTAVSL